MTCKLPQNFIERMKKQLGDECTAFLRSYDEPSKRGLRVNTLKISVEDFLKLSDFSLEESEILEEGFILKSDVKVKDDPYHLAGLYYMQEPSAMSPIEAARIVPGMKVLDLCAAPGGKSGGVAVRLCGEGLLVSNEIVPSRAKILAGNLERLGITNSVVLSAHPDKLCRALSGYFDVVLIDAPCSGEGMFRRDEKAVQEWSKEHVISCANRQREILTSAQEAVSLGGALIYSTCTFSEEENEQVIAWFLDSFTEFELEFMHRLYPHNSKGEGHFVARLIRVSGGRIKKQQNMELLRCKEKDFLKFMDDAFETKPDLEAFSLRDGRVILKNKTMPLMASLSNFKIISAGITAGEMLSNRFSPFHNLFMAALGKARFSQRLDFSKDDERLLRFLKGETLECDECLKGYLPISVSGYNIGFGKASQGIVKNHIPKGLRLL